MKIELMMCAMCAPLGACAVHEIYTHQKFVQVYLIFIITCSLLYALSLTFPFKPPLPSRTPISLHFSQMALTSATGSGCRLCCKQNLKLCMSHKKAVCNDVRCRSNLIRHHYIKLAHQPCKWK